MSTTKVTQKFKDSGIEWIGKIPRDWSARKIKEVTRLQIGWTPDTSISSYFEGDNPWVTIADMSTKYITETKDRISDKAVLDTGIKRVKKGSLLYSFKLSVGKVAFAGMDLYTNEAIAAFESNDKIDTGFLYYAFSDYLLNYSNENIYGAKLLNQHLMKNAVVVVPVLSVQKKLAAFLDSKISIIDRAIEQKQRLTDLLKEKRTAIINQAVTRGLDSDAELVDSGLDWIGKIPKGWKLIKFKFLGSFVSGGTPDTNNLEYWDGDIPWVTPKDMKVSELEDSEDHLTLKGLINTAGDIIPSGSLLLVYRSGILRHTIPTAINRMNTAINQDIRAVLLRDDMNAKYLHYLIQGKQDALLAIWSKMGATVESLEHGYVVNSKLPLPGIKEQLAVVLYLDKATKKVNEALNMIERSIQLLIEYRSSLIAHIITGKVDV